MGWNMGVLKVLAFTFVLQNANAMEEKELKENTSIPKIEISKGEEKKVECVRLYSQNLYMRNMYGDQDLTYYFQIFSNKETMKQYMEGIPRPEEEIKKRHSKYDGWWNDGNPYSSYLTFLNKEGATQFISQQKTKQTIDSDVLLKIQQEFKKTKKIFIGHVLLEPGEDRFDTDAEISYVFLPAFWRKGYGTEAVRNIFELSKALLSEKITLNQKSITALIATARPDNPGSCGVLEKNEFKLFKTDQKHGAIRNFYFKNL